MASRTQHFKGFSIVQGDIKANVSLARFEKQFEQAQFWLDSQVMTDMVPFMPMDTHTFINETRAKSASLAGTGLVCAGIGPMGRYLYEGKVMVDSETGKGPARIPTGPNEYIYRFRAGSKLIPTNRPLKYSTHAHPNVTDHWFDAAKTAHLKDWVRGVKRIAGGGAHG